MVKIQSATYYLYALTFTSLDLLVLSDIYFFFHNVRITISSLFFLVFFDF